MNIVRAAVMVNLKQRERMVKKITSSMGDLKGKTLAVLGLSFKPNTNDIREAPSIYIIEQLKKLGATLKAYDPAAMNEMKQIFPDIIYAKDAYDAVDGADAVIIVTEWNEFRNLDLERIKSLMRGNFFFDLRNIYEPEKMRNFGFIYHSVGRGSMK
jgi:UDPglucose 6-dehydrogenase